MAASVDLLKVLNRLLEATPEYAYYCRPLPRATVADIIEEIRTLRSRVAAAGQATTEASHAATD